MISERMLWISDCVFIQTCDSLYNMVRAQFLNDFPTERLAWAARLVSHKEASVRKRKVICFTLLSVFFFVGADPVRGGATRKRRTCCVSAKLSAKSSSFFFFSRSHTGPPPTPLSWSKGCDSESRCICWGNCTYMGCLRTEFVLCFGIESHSLYNNLSRISPRWNNMALVCRQFDLCNK